MSRARYFSASTLAVAGGTLGVLAGSLFLLSSAYSLVQRNHDLRISLSPQAWGWLSDIHLDIVKSSLPTEADVLVGPSLPLGYKVVHVEADMIRVAASAPVPVFRQLPARKAKHRILRAAWAKIAQLKTEKRVEESHTTQGPIQAAVPVSAPTVAHATPVLTQKVTPVTVLTATPLPILASPLAPVLSDSTEALMMRSLHWGLRQKLYAALSLHPALHPVPSMVTAVATQLPSIESAPSVNSQWHPLQRKSKNGRVPHLRVATVIDQDLQAMKSTPRPAAIAVEPLAVQPLVIPHFISMKKRNSVSPIRTDQLLTTHAAPTSPQLFPVTSNQPPQSEVEEEMNSQDEIPAQKGTLFAEAETAAQPKLPLEIQAGKLWTQFSQAESKALPTQSAIQVSTQGASRLVNTQTAPGRPVSIPAIPVAPLTTQSEPSKTRPIVEAFDWITKVPQGGYSPYTLEGWGESHAFIGWGLAKAPDHWSTLARNKGTSIPLISDNASKLLAFLAGSTLQSETGIVFGKIAAGWSIRIAGRAERPVILNAQNQVVSPHNLEGERYFAFLNVAPGAHLIYLANQAGTEEGAVGVLAQGGMSTYTDLTQITHSSLNGRVMDGSGETPGGVGRVTVRVLGNSLSVTQTDERGQFSLPSVLTVSDYPVYVETEASDGHTHRYQLVPTQLHGATLYRLSGKSIQLWLDQLEGNVSTESGLVIAAFPASISTYGANAQVWPTVRTLSPSATLRPEVYTLDPTGQLQVGSPLTAQASRFVSVQVPEGPALVSITDAAKQTLWSDLLISSPGVINIIGPR